MNIVANAALFQVVWFATVAGAGAGFWWAGIPVLVGFAIWQLRHSQWPRADFALIGVGIVLGVVIDSLLIAGGWLLGVPFPAVLAVLAFLEEPPQRGRQAVIALHLGLGVERGCLAVKVCVNPPAHSNSIGHVPEDVKELTVVSRF